MAQVKCSIFVMMSILVLCIVHLQCAIAVPLVTSVDGSYLKGRLVKRSNNVPTVSFTGVPGDVPTMAQIPDFRPGVYEGGLIDQVQYHDHHWGHHDDSADSLRAEEWESVESRIDDERFYNAATEVPLQIKEEIPRMRKSRRPRKMQQEQGESSATMQSVVTTERKKSATENINDTFDPKKGGPPNVSAIVGGSIGGVVGAAGIIATIHNCVTGKCKCSWPPCKRDLLVGAEEESTTSRESTCRSRQRWTEKQMKFIKKRCSN